MQSKYRSNIPGEGQTLHKARYDWLRFESLVCWLTHIIVSRSTITLADTFAAHSSIHTRASALHLALKII